jgi:hypothetical protein
VIELAHPAGVRIVRLEPVFIVSPGRNRTNRVLRAVGCAMAVLGPTAGRWHSVTA